MSTWLVYYIGFFAQFLFSARLIAQWLLSEQKQRVVTPVLFWVLSLIASVLLFIYGYFRDDFAIMLGQILTYYIYIKNLDLYKQWQKIPKLFRWFILGFPMVVLSHQLFNNAFEYNQLFKNDKNPLGILILGIVAQIVFVFRFIYQWCISEIKKMSILPLGFWLFSVIGASLILIYALIRKDWVLILGHSFGLLIYLRNIYFIKTNNDKSI